MNNYIKLTKILFKNGSSLFDSNKSKSFKNILFAFVVIAAFSPMLVGIGAFVSGAYTGLAQIGQQGLVLGLGLSGVSLAVFFFGIFYVINVFYFSKDIENLLPLPLRPYEILLAKLTVTLIYEYITEIIFLLPIIITYGIKANASVGYYVYGFIIFLTLPIVPLVAASILDMLVLRFTNIAKNKDRFRIVGGIVAMFIALGVNAYIQKVATSTTDINKLQELLKQGNNSLLGVVSTMFPSVKLGALAIINYSNYEGILNLVKFLGINIIALILFIFVGEWMYFKGVLGVSEASSSRNVLSTSEIEKSVVQSTSIKSYTIKELRLLFRTPIYFMNCILMNFLWPLFLVIPVLLQPEAMKDFDKLSFLAQNPNTTGILLAGAFVFGIFITASNCITSTAISREGQNIFFCKYIPVSYKDQLIAKLLSGVIMGLVGNFMIIVTAILILQIPAYLIPMISFVCFIGILFSSFTGLILDLYFPKLHWDNEQKAVKQNLNVLFNMMISTTVGGAMIGIISVFKISLIETFFIITVFYGILDVVLYKFITTVGVRVFRRIEA